MMLQLFLVQMVACASHKECVRVPAQIRTLNISAQMRTRDNSSGAWWVATKELIQVQKILSFYLTVWLKTTMECKSGPHAQKGTLSLQFQWNVRIVSRYPGWENKQLWESACMVDRVKALSVSCFYYTDNCILTFQRLPSSHKWGCTYHLNTWQLDGGGHDA